MGIQANIHHLPTYKKYQKVTVLLEEHLQSGGFLKVDLPVLLPALIPESYLEIFETEYRFLDKRQKLYLTPSPELLLKRLLVDGIGDCYYLGKAFRNSEPASSKHLGEFTMLEMYKVGATYLDMADIVLKMLQTVQSKMQKGERKNTNSMMIEYQGVNVDLSKWERMTVAEAFLRYAGVEQEILFDHEKFIAHAKKKGYQTEKTEPSGEFAKEHFSYEELWSQMYTNEIEQHLGMNGFPTLLFDYPVEFASLSKPNTHGRTAQRFEFYIAGVELGNCYGELNDWKLQQSRLQFELQEREKSGKISHVPDWGFVDALKKGLPDSAGIAIGIERLGMIFTNTKSIEELKLVTL